MRKRKENSVCNDLGLLLMRVVAGLYFFNAGYQKIFALGSEKWMGIYKTMQPHWLDDNIASYYGHAIPYAELVLGVLLFFGVVTRLSGFTMFAMVASFTVAIVQKDYLTMEFAEGLEWHEQVWQTIQSEQHKQKSYTNAVYAFACLMFFFTGAGRFSIDHMLFHKYPEPDSDG